MSADNNMAPFGPCVDILEIVPPIVNPHEAVINKAKFDGGAIGHAITSVRPVIFSDVHHLALGKLMSGDEDLTAISIETEGTDAQDAPAFNADILACRLRWRWRQFIAAARNCNSPSARRRATPAACGNADRLDVTASEITTAKRTLPASQPGPPNFWVDKSGAPFNVYYNLNDYGRFKVADIDYQLFYDRCKTQ
jgi:hypothetical protein